LLGLIAFLMVTRTDVEATILKATGSSFELLDDGRIRNIYTISVVNKTAEELPVELRLKSAPGELELLGPKLIVPASSSTQSVFAVMIPADHLYTASRLIEVQLASKSEVLETVRTTFAGPHPGGTR
jgi:hypothetical protein